jgi:hypothetical protein
MVASNESSEYKWYKSPRFRIFLHLLAGFCLMSTANNSGLTTIISRSLNFTQSDDVVIPIITMILSGIVIVFGYFLSSRLTSALDRSGLREIQKSWITFSLPVVYFVLPLVVSPVIKTLTG